MQPNAHGSGLRKRLAAGVTNVSRGLWVGSVVRCPRLGYGKRFRLRLVQRSTSLRRKTQQSISVRGGEGSPPLMWTKHGNHKKQTSRRNVRECGNYHRPSNKHSTRSDTCDRDAQVNRNAALLNCPAQSKDRAGSLSNCLNQKPDSECNTLQKNNTLHRGHRHNGNDWSDENFAILTFAHLWICSIDLKAGESRSW